MGGIFNENLIFAQRESCLNRCVWERGGEGGLCGMIYTF